MRVAIIGAGAAGLAALRHCVNVKNNDFENPEQSSKFTTVICYERSDQVGGTWVYTPKTGVDSYGIPIHSSMYNSLRANLPKEVMGYPDFPIPENSKSYLSRKEILEFLNSYCDNFQLRQFIQFLHHVEFVEPISTGDGKWAVRVKDLKNNKVTTNVFDAIMICNGHYFEPNKVSIEGSEVFKGSQMHSHDYRIPEVFSGKRIVVFGAGPSGMDLALEISRTADRVILSHHTKDPILTKFPDNVIQKADLARLTENEAIFMDGSKEAVDVIFYCTGYKYSFPFLSDRCGVRVKSNMVTPLWKHLISIENPSLAFIGLPFYVCAFSMFDLQVRFVLQFWLSKKELPSKKDMLDDESEELKRRYSQGLTKRQFHMMGPDQGSYYQDLAETAGITPLPPVLTKLHNESSMRFLDDLVNYREDRYAIIDDWNFVKL